MKFCAAGPAEGGFALPSAADTAPLAEEAADGEEQEQSPQIP